MSNQRLDPHRWQSVGERLDVYKGFGPGFETLRVGLAIGVLWFHSFVVLGHDRDVLFGRPSWIVVGLILPMFFAVAGFLTASSAQRLRLHDFLINRGLRMLPALAVEIFISAFIIGLIFTQYRFTQYFSNREFLHYFGNIIGWIHYDLPGVFLNNPFGRTVNLSLWTIPLEFICYVLMAGLMAAGLAKKPWVVTFCAFLLLLLPMIFASFGLAHSGDQNMPAGLANTGGSCFLYEIDRYLFKTSLIPAYLLGTLIYYFRYYIPFSTNIIFGLSLALLVVGLFGDPVWELNYTFKIVFIPAAAYLTVLLGLATLLRLPFYNKGDYSYGIYLYGFPLQQGLVATFPSLNNPTLHFLATVALTTAVASLSWHFVEKPVLKQRKRFSFVGRRIAAEDSLRSKQKESVAPPLATVSVAANE